jgi:hypothetical protein
MPHYWNRDSWKSRRISEVMKEGKLKKIKDDIHLV